VSLSLTGTLFRASQFLAEELPIRLAHRVEELTRLPDGLNEMPSVQKVKDWYAQSFEVRSAIAIRVVVHDSH
jgi:pyruvate dehydrogenase kinase 2/3/4